MRRVNLARDVWDGRTVSFKSTARLSYLHALVWHPSTPARPGSHCRTQGMGSNSIQFNILEDEVLNRLYRNISIKCIVSEASQRPDERICRCRA